MNCLELLKSPNNCHKEEYRLLVIMNLLFQLKLHVILVDNKIKPFKDKTRDQDKLHGIDTVKQIIICHYRSKIKQR